MTPGGEIYTFFREGSIFGARLDRQAAGFDLRFHVGAEYRSDPRRQALSSSVAGFSQLSVICVSTPDLRPSRHHGIVSREDSSCAEAHRRRSGHEGQRRARRAPRARDAENAREGLPFCFVFRHGFEGEQRTAQSNIALAKERIMRREKPRRNDGRGPSASLGLNKPAPTKSQPRAARPFSPWRAAGGGLCCCYQRRESRGVLHRDIASTLRSSVTPQPSGREFNWP